jgi:hypothetical protein
MNMPTEHSDSFEVHVERERMLEDFMACLEEGYWRDGVSGGLALMFRESEIARDMSGPAGEFVMLLAISLFESRFMKVNRD